jgi:hypothetical protein
MGGARADAAAAGPTCQAMADWADAAAHGLGWGSCGRGPGERRGRRGSRGRGGRGGRLGRGRHGQGARHVLLDPSLVTCCLTPRLLAVTCCVWSRARGAGDAGGDRAGRDGGGVPQPRGGRPRGAARPSWGGGGGADSTLTSAWRTPGRCGPGTGQTLGGGCGAVHSARASHRSPRALSVSLAPCAPSPSLSARNDGAAWASRVTARPCLFRPAPRLTARPVPGIRAPRAPAWRRRRATPRARARASARTRPWASQGVLRAGLAWASPARPANLVTACGRGCWLGWAAGVHGVGGRGLEPGPGRRLGRGPRRGYGRAMVWHGALAREGVRDGAWGAGRSWPASRLGRHARRF